MSDNASATDLMQLAETMTQGGSIRIRNEAFYVAKFTVSYNLQGRRYHEESGHFGSFENRTVIVPEGATDILLEVFYRGVFAWSSLFEKRWPSPPTICYKVWGTIFSPQHAEVPCD
jgi:hypothetical protein